MTLPVLPLWAKIVLVGIAAAVFIVGKYYFKLSDSNPVEQITEEVIEEETGVNAFNVEKDITPVSPLG